MELVGKNPLINAGDIEIQVPSLGREDPLEKGMATHPSILTWRIPWIVKPGSLQSIELQRVRHDWSNLAHMHPSTKYSVGGILRLTELVNRFFLWYLCVCVCVCFSKFFIWVWKLGNCFYIKIYFLLTTLIVAVWKLHLLACSKLYPSPTLEQKEKIL